jgi:hypothetical protein
VEHNILVVVHRDDAAELLKARGWVDQGDAGWTHPDTGSAHRWVLGGALFIALADEASELRKARTMVASTEEASREA